MKLEYTYGEYLAAQIDEVITRYKLGFDTNQLCMAIGDEKSIYLKDPPCLRLVDTRIQDNKLNFILYFRSWDLWGGFPTNLGGLQMLKEYMAKEIGVGDGSIVAFSKGLHLYEHCWDLAKMVLRLPTEQ
jgi:thymidylate synthase